MRPPSHATRQQSQLRWAFWNAGWTRWTILATAIAGFVLFAWLLRRVGYGEVGAGFRSLGWGFAVVFALGGLRFAVRAMAWVRCVEPPERLGFGDAFAAFLAGDTLNTLTPAGMLASEPTKALVVADRLSAGAAAASIAIENILYSLSVGLMITSGALVFLHSADVSTSGRRAILATVAACLLTSVALAVVMTTRRRPLTRLLSHVAARPDRGSRLVRWTTHIATFEGRVVGFAGRESRRWWTVLGLETSYHVAAVFEVWLTLVWILPVDARPTLVQAVVLESMNRLVTVLFKVVPLRVGIDEAAAGVAADALELTSATGVTLALIRKARILCWTVAGLAMMSGRELLVRRSSRLRGRATSS